MTKPMLRTNDGTPVVIGQRLGRGGEGTVFTVVNASRLALKLYHEPAHDRAHRLQALIERTIAGASPAVAWPKRCVLDQSRATVGFLMEAYSDARPIHELYTPLTRRTYFPPANDAFLVRAALNLARVVARLHDDGFVIGDLNHSSALVLPNATVRLVDADSFPLAPHFICPVGTPEYLSADLQGADLRTVRRQSRHDVFALSVLIHQLLFDGRHPFAGYGGRPSANLSDNIRRVKRYTVTDRKQAELSGKLGSDRGVLTKDLFQKVFSPAHASKVNARAWVNVLTAR